MAGVDCIFHLLVGVAQATSIAHDLQSVLQRRVRQVDLEVHVPCRLSKIGVRADLKLTLFLAENGGILRPVRSSLCSPFMTHLRLRNGSIGDCQELQCVTRRVRQVEPDIHVPCRLPVGAQNCTKNRRRPDLKLTLFLVDNWLASIAFFTCSLAPHKRYGLHRSAVCYTASAAGRTGNPCTWPALGYCPKLNRKLGA